GYTDEKTAYVPAGKSLALNIVGDGWDYEQVTFSSSNASVAKGLSDGIEKCIKGIKPGTATITAKSKLGKLKIKVVVLPKMSLQMKNFKTVTKNGKTVGYSLQVTNKSNKPFTVVEGVMGDSEGFSIGKVKGGKVVVKPGATKTVTFLVDFWEELDFLFEIARDGKLLDDFAPGIAVKYEGKTFAQWYDADGKTTSGSMYMGKWSTR
ncbi:MAG: hypothetical protein J6B28_09980, partial [Eubacterium sp.]|nr:hypothetical protein [Eubacterium sp.]